MKVITLYLVVIILASCGSTKQASEHQANISKEISQVYNQKLFNGFAVAVVSENGTLYEQGFGFSNVKTQTPYTPHTIQNIASISKTIVGVALLKAQELGKLDLDDPIQQYLPFTVANPNFPDTPITIRQLTNHTSSIIDNGFYYSNNYCLMPNQNLEGLKLDIDEEMFFNPADSLPALGNYLEYTLSKNGKWNSGSFSQNKPGSIYEYSNVATALAAYIIEQATGEPFPAFTRKHILEPLKMHQSGWRPEEVSISSFSRLYENPNIVLPYYEMSTYPDGGFITSTNNLALFLTELINGYNGRGTLLNKESYQEYFTPQLSEHHFTDRNERNPYSESYNVGVFIGYGYTGYIGHTGGDPGVVSIMFFDPKTNLGRIMVFNTSISNKEGNDAFYQIWDILAQHQNRLGR